MRNTAPLFSLLLTWLACAAPAGGASLPPPPGFDAVLEGTRARVLFHAGHQSYARRVLDIMEDAQRIAAQRLPHTNQLVTVLLYASPDEMAQGLQQRLGYSALEIAAALKVGITEQVDYTLHLHPKTAHWDDLLTHAIFDEHIHGIIQERYGKNPSTRATWLEEGMTSYLAHELLAGRLPAFEGTFLETDFKTAFKALIEGKADTLDEISTREQWYRNITHGYDRWTNQYALAHFAVFHLIREHGFQSALALLSAVGEGRSYQEAIEAVTGLRAEAFERGMRLALLKEGFLHLYPRKTMLALAILALALFTVLALARHLVTWRQPVG